MKPITPEWVGQKWVIITADLPLRPEILGGTNEFSFEPCSASAGEARYSVVPATPGALGPSWGQCQLSAKGSTLLAPPTPYQRLAPYSDNAHPTYVDFASRVKSEASKADVFRLEGKIRMSNGVEHSILFYQVPAAIKHDETVLKSLLVIWVPPAGPSNQDGVAVGQSK